MSHYYLAKRTTGKSPHDLSSLHQSSPRAQENIFIMHKQRRRDTAKTAKSLLKIFSPCPANPFSSSKTIICKCTSQKEYASAHFSQITFLRTELERALFIFTYSPNPALVLPPERVSERRDCDRLTTLICRADYAMRPDAVTPRPSKSTYATARPRITWGTLFEWLRKNARDISH